MDKNIIWVIPFTEEKGKWHIWLGKLMTRPGVKGYDILITGDIKNQAGDAEGKKVKVVSSTFNFLNKSAYS